MSINCGPETAMEFFRCVLLFTHSYEPFRDETWTRSISRRSSQRSTAQSNGSFATVDVPVMKFVKIDGKGDPNRDPSLQACRRVAVFRELCDEICQQDQIGKRLRRSAPRRPLVG